jgi:hypothetical protein
MGTSGTVGFANMTVAKSSISYGTAPIVYVDGVQAANQGCTQDSNNYYVWYTTHFSTDQIQFTGSIPTASPTATTPQSKPQFQWKLISYIAVLAGFDLAILLE